MLTDKIIEQVMDGTYTNHPQGEELIQMDLNELCENHDLANEALKDENKGLVADNLKLAKELQKLRDEEA